MLESKILERGHRSFIRVAHKGIAVQNRLKVTGIFDISRLNSSATLYLYHHDVL